MESLPKVRGARLAFAALAVLTALALQGCGGGGGSGGGGSSATGALLAVSFIGFQPSPGAPFVPFVFRDQALEFTFDGPLDAGVLGGYLSQGSTPVEFIGVSPSGTAGIPYFAFNDQAGAQNAIQIRRNATGGPPLPAYVVGRHRDKPDTIVVDPRVAASNPFGMTASLGFAPNTSYVFIIPSGNALTFGGGHPAQPLGPTGPLPVPIPPFSTQPALSTIFQAGISFGPNPTFPTVLSIAAMSAAAGTPAQPIGEADPIIVTFSQLVTLGSINSANFVIRNLDKTNTSYPGGIPVPGSILPLTPGATAAVTYLFVPTSPYGPGNGPTEGFDIEVRIGSFGVAGIPPILGVPTGLNGTQLPLGNSLAREFRTTPCAGGCLTPGSIVEGFTSSAQKDGSFQQTFGLAQARWNDASAPNQLAGRFLSGAPTAGPLGTRIQFIVAPQPENTAPAGLFSPFDASLATSGGACPGIPSGCNLGTNPNGGSHIMHVYEATELGNTEDSLEQIEWSPVNSVTFATTYPQYSIWCGLTSTAAPIGGGAGTGLTAVYDANYNLTPYQTGIPITGACAAPGAVNPRKVACGGAQPYTVALQTTQFFPFPTLNPCFDFSTAAGTSGPGVNLLFEQNIEPGQQAPNFNRYRANAFTPVRRLIGAPLSLQTPGVCPFNNGGTFDVYRARFTFVGLVGQARSLWYDTGSPDPTYLDFIPTPPVNLQPLGTQSTWILEGTDTANPGPGTIGPSGVFIDAAGVKNPSVLSTTIDHLRYFRFRVELRGNNVTNAVPAYNGVQMAYAIP